MKEQAEKLYLPTYVVVKFIYSEKASKICRDLLTFFDVKVRIFWEGHKILQNLHLNFVLCSASQK